MAITIEQAYTLFDERTLGRINDRKQRIAALKAEVPISHVRAVNLLQQNRNARIISALENEILEIEVEALERVVNIIENKEDK